MKEEHALVAFGRHSIRRHYDEATETWCFSVVDVVAALTDSENPAVYWRVLKKRLKDEGADETVRKCNALKMPSADGKSRLTDMADAETLLRLIQSIPAPKAEPFKQWLAKVGYARIQDMGDPARSLDRAREYWKRHGRSCISSISPTPSTSPDHGSFRGRRHPNEGRPDSPAGSRRRGISSVRHRW